MGLCLFSRRSSFTLTEVGLCKLGFFRKSSIIKNSSFYRLYRGASAVKMLHDSDSDSCSNSDIRNQVSEILVYRKKLFHRNNKGYAKLSSMVVRVLKSLNWEAARLISFKRAVSQFGFHCAIDVFRMILYIFACANMPWEVFVLLKSMIYYYAKAKVKFDLVEFLLKFPLETNVVMVDVLVKVFASNLMLEAAIDVYVQAKRMGLCPGIRSCNFLLKCLVERGRKDALLGVFEEMKDSGPSPNVYTYTIMMNFYCNGKLGDRKVDMGEAHKILHEMSANQISPSVVTYGTYFNGLVRGGYVEAAVNLMDDLIYDCQPIDVYCCNAVIDALCRKGKIGEAMGVFEGMSRCKIAPDVYTYSILVRGLCESGEIEKGLVLLEEMENSNMDLKPSLATYSPLLKGLCRSGLAEASLQLFHNIGNRGCEYDQLAYGILIGGFCVQGNLDLAQKLLNEMIRSNLVPYASEYKSSMNKICKVGSTGKAWQGTKIHIHLVNDIADGYCRKGFVKKALEFLDEMRYQGVPLNIFSYSIIIKWLCKEGSSAKALELIPLMMKWNILPNVVIFSNLISGFARQLDNRMALTLYRSMQKFGVCPNTVTYTILISLYLRWGNMKMASNLHKEMILEAQYPDVITYTTIVSWFCKTGDMEEACWWFNEMYRRGCFPTVVTYTILAHGFIKKHHVHMAMRIVDEMKRRGLSPDVVTYNVLIHGCLMVGEKGIAHDIFIKMKEKGILPNEHTLSIMDQLVMGRRLAKYCPINRKFIKFNGRITAAAPACDKLCGGDCGMLTSDMD